MERILLGNGIALVGAVLMAAIGLIRRRRHILLAKCVQFGVMGVANLLLGGVSGFISALVSIARNLICLRWELTVPIKLGVIFVQAALAFSVGFAGLIDLLPALSACLFTWFLDVKDEVKLKTVIIVAQLCWVVYDLSIRNYVSFAFDIVTILSNLAGIAALKRQRRHEK